MVGKFKKGGVDKFNPFCYNIITKRKRGKTKWILYRMLIK